MGKNWAVTINDGKKKKGKQPRKTVREFTHKKTAQWFAAEIARTHKGSKKGVNPRIKKIS